jgi:hypothetical protein
MNYEGTVIAIACGPWSYISDPAMAEAMGSYGQIVNDVKLLMKCGALWKVQHVRREGNGAAHHLAKLGRP